MGFNVFEWNSRWEDGDITSVKWSFMLDLPRKCGDHGIYSNCFEYGMYNLLGTIWTQKGRSCLVMFRE
jgi:hypothetical protein